MAACICLTFRTIGYHFYNDLFLLFPPINSANSEGLTIEVIHAQNMEDSRTDFFFITRI